ncbi:MAG: ABC transporter ATP-binding protein [Sulfitobacter sp.]
MTVLSVRQLGVTLRTKPVLEDISFDVDAGEMVGLIGPNGAGKTTLMRGVLGLVPSVGRSSLCEMTADARSKQVAWMPQSREIAWPVNVRTLVGLGRIPHLGMGAKPTAKDAAAVERALAHMGLEGFADRTATRLSGGEQARVLIARALAQETPLLMADEPAAGLDPGHQISTMTCFAQLAAAGASVIVSLHDLGLAARHCTRLLVVNGGKFIADGPPREVLTPALLRDVFGITAFTADTPDGFVLHPLAAVE